MSFDENSIVLDLTQSMIGSISPNFRRVGVRIDDKTVEVVFVLETENAEDREEIVDIVDQCIALQDGPIDMHVAVIVDSSSSLAELPVPRRLVYGRRE